MGGWRRPVDVFPSPDWIDRRLRPYAIGLLCDEAQISAGSRSAIVEIPDAVSPAVQVPCIVHVGSGVPWPREVLATTTSHDIRTTNGCQERQPHTSFYPAATYTASEKRVDRQINATLEDNCHPWPPVSFLRVNATLRTRRPSDERVRLPGFSSFSEEDRTVIYLGLPSYGTASAFFVLSPKCSFA